MILGNFIAFECVTQVLYYVDAPNFRSSTTIWVSMHTAAKQNNVCKIDNVKNPKKRINSKIDNFGKIVAKLELILKSTKHTN